MRKSVVPRSTFQILCAKTLFVMSQRALTALPGFPELGLGSALLRPHCFRFIPNTLKVRQRIKQEAKA